VINRKGENMQEYYRSKPVEHWLGGTMVACPKCGSGSAYIGENGKGSVGYRCLGDCGEYFLTYWTGEEEVVNPSPLINMEGLTARDKGRLEKCLLHKHIFNSGITTLGQWLENHRGELTHKSKQERVYSSKKRKGCYEELAKPVTEYTVWIGRTGIDVPKMVYDAIELVER